MNKKVLIVMSSAIIALSASAAVMAIQGWQVVDDSGCNKCTITDNVRKCGQCGSFMKSGKAEPSEKGYVWEADFTCSNSKCGHTVRGGSK